MAPRERHAHAAFRDALSVGVAAFGAGGVHGLRQVDARALVRVAGCLLLAVVRGLASVVAGRDTSARLGRTLTVELAALGLGAVLVDAYRAHALRVDRALAM